MRIEADWPAASTTMSIETSERLPEDEVAVVHFRSEGLQVVFLGDLGHGLAETELAPLRGAEVVLVPAGGPPTIDYSDIPTLLDQIGPRIVIPMHFKTPRINLVIQPLERFLEIVGGTPVERRKTSSIEITRATLPTQRTIVVLEHAR